MGAQECIRKETDGAGDGAAVYRPRPVVLAIDDEPGVRESLQLHPAGRVRGAGGRPTGPPPSRSFGTRRVDVALLDVRMPGEPGSKVLPRILAIERVNPGHPDHRGSAPAHGGGRHEGGGEYDYLAKPWDVDEILSLVREAARQRGMERELRYLRAELDRAHGFDQLVGRHPKMVRLYEVMAQVAPTTPPCSSPRRAAPARSWSRAPSTAEPAARPAVRGRELRRFPTPCSKASCSATRRAPSPAPTRAARASSSWPTAARSSSTRSASLRWSSRPSSFACSRSRVRARRRRRTSRRRARDRGDQSRPGAGDAGAALPRGPLLPPQRGADRRSAAARAQEDIGLLVDHFVEVLAESRRPCGAFPGARRR